MKVGDRIKVYRRVRFDSEKCSFGEKHSVPIYQVKFIIIDHITEENIPYLHYDRDGIGKVYHAYDAQGRLYRKADHWEGPRATAWVRHGDKFMFSQYPSKKFSRDLTGRGFIP